MRASRHSSTGDVRCRSQSVIAVTTNSTAVAEIAAATAAANR